MLLKARISMPMILLLVLLVVGAGWAHSLDVSFSTDSLYVFSPRLCFSEIFWILLSVCFGDQNEGEGWSW